MSPEKYAIRRAVLAAALALPPALVLAPPVWAAEPPVQKAADMVVTASRAETPLTETTKSIDIVGSDDRDERQQYFLPKLLDSQPGVFLNQNGGLGQYSTIDIRGTGSQHVQYQYNGMPLRDAADTQSTLQYFIEDMYSGGNTDRVEVLKGSNSVLYGSQAMGGVVNIIPDKWQGGPKAEWRNEFGPENAYIGNARLAYGKDKYYVDFSPTYIHTDGPNYGGLYNYFYRNRGGAFGAGVKPTDASSLEFTAIFADSDLALGSSPSLDAGGNLVKNQAYADEHREGQMYQLGLNWAQTVSSLWDYTVKGSYGETERHYFWSALPGNQSNYDGDTSYAETQHNLHITDWFTANLGLDYEKQDYKGREPRDPATGDYTAVDDNVSWASRDAFVQGQFVFLDRSLFFNVGGRYNDHDEFDGKGVADASAAYLFKETQTKIHAHVGTGYRTPSLYEIYGGYLYNGSRITIGNPDLEPEESTSYEFGVNQAFVNGKVQLGVTWFRTDFDDMIIYDGAANRYANANEGKSQGVETSLRLQPWKISRFDLAYTYVDSRYKDETSDEAWMRKEYLPRNKVSLTASLYPTDKLVVAATLKWRDEKIVPLNDPSYNSVRWEEGSVATADLSATYTAWQHVDFFARIDNLFDKDYTESGYCMPGFAVWGGVKFHL